MPRRHWKLLRFRTSGSGSGGCPVPQYSVVSSSIHGTLHNFKYPHRNPVCGEAKFSFFQSYSGIWYGRYCIALLLARIDADSFIFRIPGLVPVYGQRNAKGNYIAGNYFVRLLHGNHDANYALLYAGVTQSGLYPHSAGKGRW